MNEAWTKLIVVLNKIGDVYEQMSLLAEEKREALINVQASVVNKLIVKEEALIREISILENDRAVLVEQIVALNGWTKEKIKLMDLVEKAPEEFSKEMKDVGCRLADIILKIATLNGINNNLLKQAMRVIEYNINVMSHSQATPFYESGGSLPSDKNNTGLSFLDRKA